MIIVQVKEKGEPGFQSMDNSFEANSMSFVLPLSLSSFQLRHHKMITYGKQIYPFVPHSHTILHFLCFWTFIPFWVLLFSFFLNFNSGSSIHSVLLCERYFNFNSRTEKNFWAILFKLILFSMYFDICFLLGRFWLLLAFWISFVAWDHLNIIQLVTLLPFHGSFAINPPITVFSVKWMEPQNSTLDFSILSYFTGIK